MCLTRKSTVCAEIEFWINLERSKPQKLIHVQLLTNLFYVIKLNMVLFCFMYFFKIIQDQVTFLKSLGIGAGVRGRVSGKNMT